MAAFIIANPVTTECQGNLAGKYEPAYKVKYQWEDNGIRPWRQLPLTH